MSLRRTVRALIYNLWPVWTSKIPQIDQLHGLRDSVMTIVEMSVVKLERRYKANGHAVRIDYIRHIMHIMDKTDAHLKVKLLKSRSVAATVDNSTERLTSTDRSIQTSFTVSHYFEDRFSASLVCIHSEF